jgi:osmotically-inducible protein OsmY
MTTLNSGLDMLLCSDASILDEIWKAIRQNDEIRTLDLDSISISVKDGFILLTGHLSKGYFRDLIEDIACSTPGVHTVHNKLMVDSEFTIQVAERLSQDERTRHLILPVGSAHGWVRAGGIVPSREVQVAAEEIAAQVPAVRGVLSRPRVIGESPETERRPIQPLIQAKIYQSGRQSYKMQNGIVTQVVIQLRNRLVTHAVVRTSDFYDGKFVFHEYFIPVEAMDVVKKESIFLKRNAMHLSAYPAFQPTDAPPAPLDCQPPYPYVAGEVRWLREQPKEMANQSSASPRSE